MVKRGGGEISPLKIISCTYILVQMRVRCKVFYKTSKALILEEWVIY